MPFELKSYQQRCLGELERYLARTRELDNADTAFYEQTHRGYRDVDALPGLPYVCVRVPTGGGKTVMAAHAVSIAADKLLRVDRCVTLWLAPTTKIVDQTIKALRDRRHPYRLALDGAFDGCVSVLSLSEALYLSRGTLEADTVVIVCTLAALRVTDTEGRKVYEANGYLKPILDSLTDTQRQALLNGNGDNDPTVPSLCNVLRSRRPLVIVDEAHNARTSLTFDTLARFQPSCVLEFTATPDQDVKGMPSNVLVSVSAAELKAEEMIKLPVRMRTRSNWKDAVSLALRKQKDLEATATAERATTGDYLRPIVLFQAQNKGKDNVTPDVLKQSLIDDYGVDESQIAICTGTIDELGEKPIVDESNPIRFIITIQKLREGWDCPFAYILCSVSNIGATTAVEQILGRVLRMPYAKTRVADELNQAYAYATSNSFAEAATALTDAIVDSGFDRFEAKSMVKAEPDPEMDLPLFDEEYSEVVTATPDARQLATLPKRLRESVSFVQTADATTLVFKGGALAEDDAKALRDVFDSENDRLAVEKIRRRSHGEDCSPVSLGKKLRVPQLAVKVDGQWELLEDQPRDQAWSLREQDASLSDSEFSLPADQQQFADIDVREDDGHIRVAFLQELDRQMLTMDVNAPQTAVELAVWLDRRIEHPEITQTESVAFLRRMIETLISDRDLSIEQVVTNRHRLQRAAEAKIAAHRLYAYREAFDLLTADTNRVRASLDVSFDFPLAYPATRFYQGPIKFQKHFYPELFHMNDEEAPCAALIDSLPQVEYWVRNLEQKPDYAFWLPLPSGHRFYPDFVAKLIGEKLLVVEYKGKQYLTNDDSKEKKRVGEQWEAVGEGDCIFRMVGKADFEAVIRSAVEVR